MVSRQHVPERSSRDQRYGNYVRLGEPIRDIVVAYDVKNPSMTPDSALSCLGSSFHRARKLWPRDQEGVQAELKALEARVLSNAPRKTLPDDFFLMAEDFYTHICELYHLDFPREPHLGWQLLRPHKPLVLDSERGGEVDG